MSTTIAEIPLDQIQPHPDNRREGGFDQEKLQQLAESIRAVGVQQPAVVRMISAAPLYELVAGERRWRAARLAGLATLPCVVRQLDDVQALRIQIIENLQREDVHPLDEANGYQRLLDSSSYDVETIAQEVGRSASYVYQRLKLQDLIPEAREQLSKGVLTAGHAILIARLSPEQQQAALEEAIENYPSKHAVPVRELADWIQSTILMDLGKAAFKKDDAELVPAAGPCTTCQKRTGYQPALFADVCKRDSCTDPECFNGKLDALVARRKAELEGTEHLLVTDGYQREAGILPQYDWEKAKQGDKGAVRVLVASGAGRGKLTWGKKVSREDRYHASPEERAYEARRRNEELRKRAFRKRLLGDVMARVRADVTASRRIPTPLLRLIVAEITRKRDIPEDANPSDLLCGLVEHVLEPDVGCNWGEPEHLYGAADLYQIDRKAIEQEVRAAMKKKSANKGKEEVA